MLKWNGESGYLCLYLILGGEIFEFLTIKYDLSCKILVNKLSSWKISPSFLSLLGIYIMNVYWILSDAFSELTDMSVYFFSFSFLMLWITLIDFKYWASLEYLE